MMSRLRKRSGQVIAEFMVLAAMVLFVSLSLIVFLAVFSEWSWRILKLIGMELP
jgi:hypothetical protein